MITTGIVMYILHEAMPAVALVMIACYAKWRIERTEQAMRLHMERLADEIHALRDRVDPPAPAFEPESTEPLEPEVEPEPLPRAFLVRDGAHVLVGTPRPLAKNFFASGEGPQNK